MQVEQAPRQAVPGTILRHLGISDQQMDLTAGRVTPYGYNDLVLDDDVICS